MSTAQKMNSLIQVQLEVLTGPHKGMKQTFLQDSIIIGRGVDAQFILGEDPKISRQHIEIQQTQEGLKLINLSKSNPSLLSGVEFVEKTINKNVAFKVGESEIQIVAEFPSFVVNELISQEPFEKHEMIDSKLDKKIVLKSPVAQFPSVHSPSTLAKVATENKISTNYQNPLLNGESRVQQNYSAGYVNTDEAKKKKIFYGILIVVLVVAYYFYNQNSEKKKSTDLYRGADRIEMDLAESQKTIESYKERKEKYSTLQSKRALENFTQGFRDYRAGQYARAFESFQVVKNLDPGNELAERYYKLAKIKFDEEIKFIMLQGRANRDKKNFRLCISNFNSVMNMLGNDKNSVTYKEAKQFFDECSLALEGRF